jgi:hypothetical protein
MVRVKFRKGMQRKFIDLVILGARSPSLRGLLQFGLKVGYSTLKSYYNENRTLPEDLFEDLKEEKILKLLIFGNLKVVKRVGRDVKDYKYFHANLEMAGVLDVCFPDLERLRDFADDCEGALLTFAYASECPLRDIRWSRVSLMIMGLGHFV